MADGPEPDPEFESALDWPAWTDSYRYEPTYADRVWHASDGQVDLFSPLRDLAHFGLMPVSGGSPDAKPIKLRRPVSAFRPWTPAECKGRDDRERFGSHGYDDRAEPSDRD